MREQAIEILSKYLTTDHLIKHSYALEAVMKKLGEKLEPEKADEWAIAGLLHDLDADLLNYKEDPEESKIHGLKAIELLKTEGFGNDYIYQAIMAHNQDNGTEIKSVLDKVIYAADPITGFITAITLVYPDKRISSVKVKSITKRMKELRFAAGANREAMKSIEDIGLPFSEFAQISLEAMQEISDTLGL